MQPVHADQEVTRRSRAVGEPHGHLAEPLRHGNQALVVLDRDAAVGGRGPQRRRVQVGALRGIVVDLANGTLAWDLAMIQKTLERFG